MKPPIPYAGGKQRLAQRIIRTFHPHDHYVEPFAGSLAVLLAKPPSMMETVNDLNGDIVTFWRVLRDRPHDLAWACGLTPHSRAEYPKAIDGDAGEVERARQVWSQLAQGRAGASRAGWRHVVTAAAKGTMPGYLDGYLARLLPAAERIRNVSLECRPALDLIRAYDAPGTLFYLDPPYLRATRNSQLYAREMGDEASHQELLDVIRDCQGQVVLSGYSHPLYDTALHGWTRTEFAARNASGSRAVEVLWANREQPHLFGAAA